MISGRYAYPADRLDSARRALIAPQEGEAAGFVEAMRECALGLQGLKAEDFDDESKRWSNTIGEVIRASDGTVEVTADDKLRFFEAVERLAAWLKARFEGVG